MIVVFGTHFHFFKILIFQVFRGDKKEKDDPELPVSVRLEQNVRTIGVMHGLCMQLP